MPVQWAVEGGGRGKGDVRWVSKKKKSEKETTKRRFWNAPQKKEAANRRSRRVDLSAARRDRGARFRALSWWCVETVAEELLLDWHEKIGQYTYQSGSPRWSPTRGCRRSSGSLRRRGCRRGWSRGCRHHRQTWRERSWWGPCPRGRRCCGHRGRGLLFGKSRWVRERSWTSGRARSRGSTRACARRVRELVQKLRR